ncbi:MAG: hypothetical protein C0503_04125 [Gemmatimonas sp.]|nr:hypothetical protein [Gemmatimonas sp.]
MRLTVNAVLGAAMLALMACGREQVQQANVVRADSAGVRIVTSTGRDTVLPWRFDTIGVLSDSLGEPWLFTGVSPQYVITDRAGRTYVFEREPAIRRFGRDGRFERNVGRKGGAPGEMELPFQLLQQGDSIAVLDPGRNALVRWGPDLEPIADIPLRGGFEGVMRVAFRTGGLWQMVSSYDSTGNIAVLRGDTTGETVLARLYEPVPKNPRMLTGCGGRVTLTQPNFFARSIHWDAEGARALVYAGPNYELALYEGNRLLASVRRDLPTRSPTIDDLRRQFPDGLKLQIPGAECTIPLSELMAGPTLEGTMPFAFGVVLLSDGSMWVQRSVRNEKPAVLDVFGSDGAYAGTVRGYHLPVGLLPNGELLVPIDDEESGGLVIARMRVLR